MARLYSKSCFLALIIVFLFVTFAAFFDSLPKNPYYGAASSLLNPNQDSQLQDAAGQAPAQEQSTSMHHAFTTTTSTRATAPAPTLEPETTPEKEQTEEERKKAEDKKRIEEMRKKQIQAAKVAKQVDFTIPDDIKYDPAGPRPDQIILLCASDGKGHNGGIENLFEQTQVNRQAYADFHGYTYHFINISKYDIGGSHPVWAKLPAIAETFNTFPDAQWIWWLDLDALIMTPSVDLNELLLSHAALEKKILTGQTFNRPGGGETEVATPEKFDVKNIDLIFSQDHNGINAGSFFIRRSHWTRMFMDIWADPVFIMKPWLGQEQSAVLHLALHHRTVLEHFALVPQTTLNAYAVGTPGMGWQKGDLVVHLAGCWVEDQCSMRWEQYSAMKEALPEKLEVKEPTRQEPELSTDAAAP
ncbi:uncharacterized protein H6S33_007794 [Morchella sextelata]|uniref:uncharacterized protein n=1 Tax=Morchella sextelata TaxID=1174677 RepID=UPI001D05BB04|nr:uncharacterized protein H6S33_007794 [Morchella sextelata]KAH0603472.1 hypothetical protein H6S33_007794 [Morchella sextelata]